jgi:hypothetical protein
MRPPTLTWRPKGYTAGDLYRAATVVHHMPYKRLGRSASNMLARRQLRSRAPAAIGRAKRSSIGALQKPFEINRKSSIL